MRTATVDLPLHPGKCPPWLFERMRPLSKEISRIIIDNYGTAELLSRLSDPMFFQALSCVIGFDWHSSGTTTTTCGALKEALSLDMGIAVAGGKGRTSRLAPFEIEQKAERFGLDSTVLKKASFLCAKVDSSCIQDSYELYHHCFFFDEKGNWAVVQQGMNDTYARRYHWLSTSNFVDSPPNKIAGVKEDSVLNLVSSSTCETRKVSLDLVKDNPNHLRKFFTGQMTLFDEPANFAFPARHEILKCDLSRKDWVVLEEAYELQPKNYEDLLCVKGMGRKKIRALALVSQLIYGTPLDWQDPVKYSFAHGGKDGFPFPVERDDYDHTINFLKDIVNDVKSKDKEHALKILARF